MAIYHKLTRILYFFPMFIVSACMACMFAVESLPVSSKQVKFEKPPCSEPLYYKQVCDASTLRSEFSKRRCCANDCIGKLLHMSRDETVNRCCDHHFRQLSCCQPISSSSSPTTTIDHFTKIVQLTRNATSKFRITAQDHMGHSANHINEKEANGDFFYKLIFKTTKNLHKMVATITNGYTRFLMNNMRELPFAGTAGWQFMV